MGEDYFESCPGDIMNVKEFIHENSDSLVAEFFINRYPEIFEDEEFLDFVGKKYKMYKEGVVTENNGQEIW